jgi:hypothetical protein
MREILVLCFVVASLAACQTMKYDLQAKPEVPLAPTDAPFSRAVETHTWSHYLFWGLLPLASFDLNEFLLGEIKAGGNKETVGIVRVDEQTSFTSGIATILTAGFYRPRDIRASANLHAKGTRP